jgi:hypothetical protein
MHTSLFLTIILSLQKSHPTPAYGLDTTEWRDDGTAPKNAKPRRIKNSNYHKHHDLSHTNSREIQLNIHTTSTNINNISTNINTTLTHHNTHQKVNANQ